MSSSRFCAMRPWRLDAARAAGSARRRCRPRGSPVGCHHRHREDDRLGAPLPDDAGDEGPWPHSPSTSPLTSSKTTPVFSGSRDGSERTPMPAPRRSPAVGTRALRGSVQDSAVLATPLSSTPSSGNHGCWPRPVSRIATTGRPMRAGSSRGGRAPTTRQGFSSDAWSAVLGERSAGASPDAAGASPDAAGASPDAAGAPQTPTAGGEDVLDIDAAGHAPAAPVATLSTLASRRRRGHPPAPGAGPPELVVEERNRARRAVPTRSGRSARHRAAWKPSKGLGTAGFGSASRARRDPTGRRPHLGRAAAADRRAARPRTGRADRPRTR